jgi:hypothetical protein
MRTAKPGFGSAIGWAIACGFATLLSGNAHASNSLPCVKEVCVGDGIERLRTIDWEPARHLDHRISNAQMKRLRSIYVGDIARVAPYLKKGVFDNDALHQLSRIDGACRMHDLIGKFVSDGGNPTQVTLRLLPEAGKRQTWRVVFISRSFPDARSRRDQETIKRALDERYGAHDIHRHPPRPGEGGYLYSWIGHPVALLSLTLPDPRSVNDTLALHPGCGSRTPPSID